MKHLNLIDKVKVQYDFLKLIKNPNDTKRIVSMGQTLTEKTEPVLLEKLLKHSYANTRFEQMWEEKYFPHIPPLKKLSDYPKKSLGHEYYLHMTKLNLDPELFPKPDLSSREMYLITRVYQSHDLWHVLTGFDTSVEQELGLQAFGIAQYKSPLGSLIIAGGILHLIQKDPWSATDVMHLISKGYEMGSQCSFLLAENVVDEMDQPLKNLRLKYNLKFN